MYKAQFMLRNPDVAYKLFDKKNRKNIITASSKLCADAGVWDLYS